MEELMSDNDCDDELKVYLEKQPETRFVEILAADMNGILRGKWLPVSSIFGLHVKKFDEMKNSKI